MTPQELKSSILQLAVQGRLVEQRPEEGTAEELYRQIQEEKQRLIKEGKIKKEKPLPEITEDEVPFDIPESWKWVRLGSVGESNIGLTYRPSDKTDFTRKSAKYNTSGTACITRGTDWKNMGRLRGRGCWSIDQHPPSPWIIFL